MERFWQWLLNDAYWYCAVFFVCSIVAEEVLAPYRRWRNRDDQIVYGQRDDSPANIRSGRSKPPKPKHHDAPPPQRHWWQVLYR
jgi:hypothetical protein